MNQKEIMNILEYVKMRILLGFAQPLQSHVEVVTEDAIGLPIWRYIGFIPRMMVTVELQLETFSNLAYKISMISLSYLHKAHVK